MTDSVETTVTQDNLFVGDFPVIKDSREIPISTTAIRGTVLGLIKYGAVTPVADGGNTGDGTCTAAATINEVVKPIVGAYNLECVVALTNGGTFKLVDPNGALVASGLVLTVGAGSVTVFKAGGLTFTITDGATDFAVGDKFALTLAAGSGEVVALDHTAVDGSGEFDSILLDNITTTTAVKSAAVAETGSFRQESLTFGGSTTIADVRADMRKLSCFVRSASEGVGV